MIARVYGTANGEKTVFSYAGGSSWEAVVPANGDGECAVEIWAEDEAGNVAYMATMLFTASGHQMRCYIVPRGYTGDTEAKDYRIEVDAKEIFAQILKGTYAAFAKEKQYAAKISERRYCIELELCGENQF